MTFSTFGIPFGQVLVRQGEAYGPSIAKLVDLKGGYGLND